MMASDSDGSENAYSPAHPGSIVRSLLISPPGTPFSTTSIPPVSSNVDINFTLSPGTADLQQSNSFMSIPESHEVPSMTTIEELSPIPMQSTSITFDRPTDRMKSTPLCFISEMPSDVENLSQVEWLQSEAERTLRDANNNGDRQNVNVTPTIMEAKWNLEEAMVKLKEALRQNTISNEQQQMRTTGSFLASFFDHDESVEGFLKSISSPASDFDETLGNEDDGTLDKLIERTIDAFGLSNNMTRGYLAKIPEYQHKFLVGFNVNI